MLILVVYDIETVTPSGKDRLRRVARACEAVGRRIQNSVFECIFDAAQFRAFRQRLTLMIDPQTDSLRFYNLGNSYRAKVQDTHPEAVLFQEDPLIL